ncbi:YeiH family protein [Oceanibacterium hippocampi]|uniref:Sulfate exporter family transporter n=1 Tax=Oceanibacterium hippocampi TaxID=745714 RepID=A0A1Y5SXT9_9PROT|nr:putative sulfate exporter family transporter [Oceanibacterium hippocampi]SLN47645.1 hypothetical protein OCH7691_02056 [Oceanibacterium hippocampi]
MSRFVNAVAGSGPRRIRAALVEIAPGLALTCMIAAAAAFVSATYGGPVMLLALLMGMALNFTAEQPRAAPGIRFASKRVLRFGVALLGLRITFGDVMALGLGTIELVVAGVLLTIAAGIATAALLGSSRTFGVLVGGATAICGASAALAIASVLPQRSSGEKEVIFTVVSVTALSTLAMIIYPALFSVLGFSHHEIGILLGATIHDVAQVVGAGYAVSDEAGDTATIVKLFRVALLLPTVFVISLVVARRGRRNGGGASLIPFFALGFAALVVVRSSGVLPDAVLQPLSDLSRGCLVAAVAAIGLSTSMRDIVKVGYRPVVMAGTSTLVLLVFSMLAVAYAL